MRTSQRPVNPDYGRGHHVIHHEDVEELLVDPVEVRARVRAVWSAPDYHPPLLPAAAMEVHRLSREPRVDFDEVVEVLEDDQVLASDILRVAQSPAFVRRRPPSSLRDAVSRLGLSNLRDIVFGVAFQAEVFRAPGYAEVMEAVRDHSVGAAHVARLLARGTPVAEYAFLCGLLHDVGAAAVVLALAETRRSVAPEALACVVEELHEEAGAMLFDAWDLPPSLRTAVTGHHAPQTREAALALVAHEVANEAGRALWVGGQEAERVGPARFDRACEILNLRPDGLEKLRAEAAELLEAL